MKPFSVYIHIPFCTVKCGYCDFNAYAGMDALKDAYRDAVLAEVDAWRAQLGPREVVSVGFGGGTPGEVPPDHIATMLDAVRGLGPLADGAEVTLEANPGSTGPGQLEALRAAGVTRISFGVQSFDAGNLAFLDRIHSAEAARACVRQGRAAGFDGVNLDLIYGLPGQDVAAWLQDVEGAIALGPDHVSCYALTVEEGTPLARRVAAGAVLPVDPDTAADMYEAADGALSAAGFEQYELSNWAQPGHESRHNLGYWTDREYVGIGAGAHGFLDGKRYENVAHPRAYIAAFADSAATAGPEGWPGSVSKLHTTSPATVMADWLALRLRLTRGFVPEAFAERFGVALEHAVGPVIALCQEQGLLEPDGAMRLTSRGRQLHSEVAVRLLVHLEAGVTGQASGESGAYQTGL